MKYYINFPQIHNAQFHLKFSFTHFTYRSVWAYAASGFECVWIWLRRSDIGRACRGHWCQAWLKGWYKGGKGTEYLLTWNIKKVNINVKIKLECAPTYIEKLRYPYIYTLRGPKSLRPLNKIICLECNTIFYHIW